MAEKQSLSKVFGGEPMVQKILTQLETISRFWQLKYMNPRRTKEVVEKGRLLFHPEDCGSRIMLKYQERLKSLKIK